MYIIRTSQDEVKAQVADETAFRIVSRIKGHQDTFYHRDGKKACFVFDEDAAWGTDSIQIMIWRGDYIYFKEN